MAGVYIHIPFCKQLCSYCDFYFSVSLARKQDMLDALLYEMDLKKVEGGVLSEYNEHDVATLYFGGGTPTVYSPWELEMLASKALSLFLPNGIEEFTVEANPDDLTPEYLESLNAIGVNRLSIGIQSFTDRDLRWMRRRHTARQAINSVVNARKAGFNNISIDLIYGIPGMSEKEWEENVRQALELNVPHLSAYHLTIESKTILGKQQKRGLFKPVDDEISAWQYALFEKLTAEAGYIHYEISNFAKPGCFSKHNSSYWQQKPYIGIGPSAHSYDGKNLRRWNVANNKKYIDALFSGNIYYEEEHLSIYDRYNEYILTSLRTSWGIDMYGDINNKFGDELYSYFLKQAIPLLNADRLEFENDCIYIPSKYFFVSDSIINRLFYVS
ncbi:MAG: radical SAM family heme chaperone HemW [Prevotellaceae bacterium]|nr:radical SAM family heme chaperone HemW [Prevotellaceae bacterium]